MDKPLKNMRKESNTMPASINIGKNGLSDTVVANIKEELSRNKLVKLKILPSYLTDKNKNAVFDEIAEKTGAKIVQKIGFTLTLTRR